MKYDGYRPTPWLRGPLLETIVPSFWPAPPVGGVSETHVVEVAPDAAVRIEISRPDVASKAPRGTLLLVHGMSGCAESGYMRRTASLALEMGWVAVRMNCRNCGGTEALSRTLYNAGQSDDIGRVLEHLARLGFPRPFAAVGFSLGGNLVLRYAGLAGEGCAADVVAGVNPPVDLEACCTALERRENAIYHAHFSVTLASQLRRIQRLRPLPGPRLAAPRWVPLRRIDTLYTAPDAGYPTAEAYYAGASAGPHLSGIRVPVLVVSARNDPFVPVGIFEAHRTGAPDRLRFIHPSRGGHLGYWQAGAPRFWAGKVILEFLNETT